MHKDPYNTIMISVKLFIFKIKLQLYLALSVPMIQVIMQ
jgi:hypothetical protein